MGWVGMISLLVQFCSESGRCVMIPLEYIPSRFEITSPLEIEWTESREVGQRKEEARVGRRREMLWPNKWASAEPPRGQATMPACARGPALSTCGRALGLQPSWGRWGLAEQRPRRRGRDLSPLPTRVQDGGGARGKMRRDKDMGNKRKKNWQLYSYLSVSDLTFDVCR